MSAAGPPRVAFFADSFHEVNGVANTSRQFDAFARRRQLPFLSIHAGPKTGLTTDGSVSTLELARGSAAFGVEQDMSFDPLLGARLGGRVAGVLRDFRPDVIHITGPSDVGIVGVWASRRLKIPLVASWHTNLHEFGARRLNKLISFLPAGVRTPIVNGAESGMLFACATFYRFARVLMAPNQELIDMLAKRTGKPTFLMQRGADTYLYTPARRTRSDSRFVFGYVGRITPEKNVRLLADLERGLAAAGESDYSIVVIGHGSETEWLRQKLKHAEFPGVLKGEALAAAYANMDAFVFPSHTDTFGNVILEAAASGVPSVVTPSGGPKFLVQDGVSGLIARDDAHFVDQAVAMMQDRAKHAAMRAAAREYALTMSWDAVFEKVYRGYDAALNPR